MNNQKSLIVTYILSLIGGLFGLHHLYLGRTQHALLWLTTFGGCGLGFLYEFLFLIRTYVAEANDDRSIIREYQFQMNRRKSPALEIFRLCGQYLTALFYGFMTYYAFPDTWHEKPLLSVFIGCCSTFAIAVGTQITGTLGPRRCSFIWPLLGANLGIPFLVWRANVSPAFNIPAFLSSFVFEWKIQWNPTYFSSQSGTKSTQRQSLTPLRHERRHFIKRCLLFGVGVMVFSAIFTSAIYQNLQVNVNDRHVRIKDVLADFFRPQGMISFYQQLSNIRRQLWSFYWQFGLKGIWTEIWMSIDFENEKQAYKILQLGSGASQRDIESQCRALPRKWHPDRYRDPAEKQTAEAIFLNIQQACDRLSHERQRRQILNAQRREDPN